MPITLELTKDEMDFVYDSISETVDTLKRRAEWYAKGVRLHQIDEERKALESVIKKMEAVYQRPDYKDLK